MHEALPQSLRYFARAALFPPSRMDVVVSRARGMSRLLHAMLQGHLKIMLDVDA